MGEKVKAYTVRSEVAPPSPSLFLSDPKILRVLYSLVKDWKSFLRGSDQLNRKDLNTWIFGHPKEIGTESV